jgi:hypothetical protein
MTELGNCQIRSIDVNVKTSGFAVVDQLGIVDHVEHSVTIKQHAGHSNQLTMSSRRLFHLIDRFELSKKNEHDLRKRNEQKSLLVGLGSVDYRMNRLLLRFDELARKAS